MKHILQSDGPLYISAGCPTRTHLHFTFPILTCRETHPQTYFFRKRSRFVHKDAVFRKTSVQVSVQIFEKFIWHIMLILNTSGCRNRMFNFGKLFEIFFEVDLE